MHLGRMEIIYGLLEVRKLFVAFWKDGDNLLHLGRMEIIYLLSWTNKKFLLRILKEHNARQQM